MFQDWCIIHNPAAGRGRARERVRRLERRLRGKAVFWPTRAPGHASELAVKAAHAGFTTVAAAGGDGTVHEVACGLLQSSAKQAALGIFPVGSANDYAYSLGLRSDWWRDGRTRLGTCRVDVGMVRAPGGRERHFINGIGIGFNCCVTVEAIRLPRLQGVALYSVALLRALWSRYASPVMTVTTDDVAVTGPSLALTIALGQREGNFILAPDAKLDDGWFDYLHVGPLTRKRLISYVPRMITGRIPVHDPKIRTGRCRQAEVRSESPIIAHTDGEPYCLPEDDLRILCVELIPAGLSVRVPLRNAPEGLTGA